jgi:hypothetical protein
MKNSILLIIFLMLFVSFLYLFGSHELWSAFEHPKIKESPGFTTAKSTRVVTVGPNSLDTKRVVFYFEVNGKTYSVITNRTDHQGAVRLTSRPEYSRIIYDKRDPKISTLQHFYDYAEKDRSSLGKTMVVVSILAIPAALVVTALIWLIALLAKRARQKP